MAALCTEELAVDFVEHMRLEGNEQSDKNALTSDENNKEIMDIKLFVDDDTVSIIIRNDALPYNPLNFQMDEESFSKMGVVMAQKIARKVDYNYMFRMNVVTIVLDNSNK